MLVFCHFPRLSLRCHNTHPTGCIGDVGRSEGVCAGRIPDKQLSTLPGDQCNAIRSLPVRTVDPCRFQARRDLGRGQGTMNNVIEGRVPIVAALAPAAAEALYEAGQ